MALVVTSFASRSVSCSMRLALFVVAAVLVLNFLGNGLRDSAAPYD